LKELIEDLDFPSWSLVAFESAVYDSIRWVKFRVIGALKDTFYDLLIII